MNFLRSGSKSIFILRFPLCLLQIPNFVGDFKEVCWIIYLYTNLHSLEMSYFYVSILYSIACFLDLISQTATERCFYSVYMASSELIIAEWERDILRTNKCTAFRHFCLWWLQLWSFAEWYPSGLKQFVDFRTASFTTKKRFTHRTLVQLHWKWSNTAIGLKSKTSLTVLQLIKIPKTGPAKTRGI